VAVKVGTAPAEQLGGDITIPEGEEDPLEAFLAEGGDNLIVE
jgi:hypothetical protein